MYLNFQLKTYSTRAYLTFVNKYKLSKKEIIIIIDVSRCLAGITIHTIWSVFHNEDHTCSAVCELATTDAAFTT